MSLSLIAALTVSGAVLPQCSWDRPGANPFQGDVVAAVDRYQDIPVNVRAALKKRVADRQYDEVADITRDRVQGAYQYTNLRDMHFGQGTVCRTVTRHRWTSDTVERGLVYCEQGHCIIVPTVCRNVSRVTRVAKAAAAAPAAAPTTAMAPVATPSTVAEAPASMQEVAFEPPGAGAAQPLGSAAPAGTPEGANVLSPGAGTFQALSAPFVAPLAAPSTSLPPLFAEGGAAPGVLPPAVFTPGLPPVPGVLPPLDSVALVPEPSSYALAAAGLAVLIWARRRRLQRPNASR